MTENTKTFHPIINTAQTNSVEIQCKGRANAIRRKIFNLKLFKPETYKITKMEPGGKICNIIVMTHKTLTFLLYFSTNTP